MAIALILFMSVSANAACKIQPFNFNFGGGTSTSVNVTGGTPCNANIRSNGTVNGIAILKAPAHGKVSVIGTYKYVYAVQKGYVGKDEFALGIDGDTPRSKGVATVTYYVNAN